MSGRFTRFDAEAIIERYLGSKGYEIMASRWPCGDDIEGIVARHRGTVVLVAVFSAGAEPSCNSALEKEMRRAAAEFADAHRLPDGASIRLDYARVRMISDGQATIWHCSDLFASK